MEKIKAIALNTYRESIRSKLLYAVMFFALAMLLLSTFFGTVTIGDQMKVIKDFGLFSISLFSVAYVVIAGSTLLNKELARKTIYNILGKAVRRSEFIAGKYLGMLFTAATLVLLMSTGLAIYLYFFEEKIDYLIFYNALFLSFELVIICAAVILFSSIVVTPVLSGLFSFAIFLAGRSSEYLSYFIQEGLQGSGKIILESLQYVLPNLDKLNVANDVVSGNISGLEIQNILWSALYSISYAAVLLIIANAIFSRREFN